METVRGGSKEGVGLVPQVPAKRHVQKQARCELFSRCQQERPMTRKPRPLEEEVAEAFWKASQKAYGLPRFVCAQVAKAAIKVCKRRLRSEDERRLDWMNRNPGCVGGFSGECGFYAYYMGGQYIRSSHHSTIRQAIDAARSAARREARRRA